MFCRDCQVVARVEEYIDGGGESPTSTVPEHNNKLQSAAQVFYCVSQTAKYLWAKAVACYADNEKIVWSLVENEFDWDTGIRTPEHSGKRTLFRCPCNVRTEAQISRINRDYSLNPAFGIDVVEKRGEIAVTVIQPEEGCITVRR